MRGLGLRRYKAIAFVAILFALLVATAIPTPVLMATAWESYTTGDDSVAQVYGLYWYGQTFTISPTSHSVVSVRLKLYRVGTPSTVTVSIRAAGEDGYPTGDDITSGTIDGDALTTSTSGSWYGISLTEASLSYGGQYAICIRAEAGDASNYVGVRVDSSSPTYAGGQAVSSSSGGITWSAVSGTDIMFQVDGNSLLQVIGAKVFNSYLEENDMFIVLSYLNTYVPAYPNEVCANHFWIQLRSTDGASVIAQTVCQQWGYMPGCLYLNANQAAALTTGYPYRIYLSSTDGVATAYYPLKSSDWQGDALDLLRDWVITTAHSMASYYQTPMTTQIQNREVLNSEGGTLFATAIPSLIQTNPELFVDISYTPNIPSLEPGGTSFDTATSWEDHLGPDVADLANTIGGFFGGISGRYIVAFIIFVLYVGICYVVFRAHGDPIIASLLCVPLLLLAASLRVIDFQLVASLGAIAIIITVYRWYWSRT
jgi:hypothetical protein